MVDTTDSSYRKPQLTEKTEKERNIILAAAKIFKKYGYQKTTLREIGKAVGMNKASLYYYFKNKEDLFLEVLLHQFSQYLQEMEDMPQDLQITKKIHWYLDKHVTFFLSNKNYQKSISMDLMMLSDETKKKIVETREKQFQILQKVIDDAMEQGEMKKIDTSTLVITLKFLFSGVLKAISSYPKIYNTNIDNKIIINKAKASISLIFDGLLENDL